MTPIQIEARRAIIAERWPTEPHVLAVIDAVNADGLTPWSEVVCRRHAQAMGLRRPRYMGDPEAHVIIQTEDQIRAASERFERAFLVWWVRKTSESTV